MLTGKLNIKQRVDKEEILNEIKKSERLACLRTFNRLFKRERSQDKDLDYVVNFHDVRNGMQCLKPGNIKDYNLDTLISILEHEQSPYGMKDAEFADWVSELLVIEPDFQIPLTNNESDGLKYVFDELKAPGKDTIDFKQLMELYNEFYQSPETNGQRNNDPKYTEEQLRKMIDVASIKGDEITYEDFRKLFTCKTF